MSWDTEFDDRYQEMAWVVADGWEMRPEYSSDRDYVAQLEAVREEVLELSHAIRGEGRDDPSIVGEELADCLITLHLLAVQLDVNPWPYYHAKQEYNMNKTGTRTESGKVIDDA